MQIRRRIALGAVAVGALSAVALREFPRLWEHRYRSSAYDDLLQKLSDRDSAQRFGKAFGSLSTAGAIAQVLRRRLGSRSLKSVAAQELAIGRMLEVHGWVVPESVALICALAASQS